MEEMKEKQMSDLEDIKRWRGVLLRLRLISIEIHKMQTGEIKSLVCNIRHSI